MKRIGVFILALVLLSTAPARAQKSGVTSYLSLHLEKYDVSATLSLRDHAVQVQAALSVSNPSSLRISRIEVKLGKTVKLASVAVNGAPVQITTRENDRTRTLSVSIPLPQPIRPEESATLSLSYSVPVEDTSARAAMTVDEAFLLPDSFWLPLIHTPYLIDYNVDVAPITLRLTAPPGMKALSSGRIISETQQGSSTTTVFQQSSLGRPMFIARDFELTAGGDSEVEVYLPRGYSLTNSKTVEFLRRQVKQMIGFYSRMFGQPAPGPIRLFGSGVIPFYGGPDVLILDERTFARSLLDIDTVYFLASNLARNWLSGRIRIQGPGHAVLYDGLPGYLGLLYLEHEFGQSAVDRMVDRFRNDYLAIVSGSSAFDAPLARQSLLNRQYYRSVFNKVPVVLRLIAHRLGREKLLAAIKAIFSGGPGTTASLNDLRRRLLAAGEAETLKPIFNQWFDRVVLPDFAVGKPVQEKGKWSVTVANFGDGRGSVAVEVVTRSGEHLRQRVNVAPEGYAQAYFVTSSEPVQARVDPDRLYIQARYDNDIFPRRARVGELIGQGSIALIQGNAVEAEAKLRQALEADPHHAGARALLGRALAALDRLDEAQTEARRALKRTLPSLTTFANAEWALGDIALKRQQAAEAVQHYRQASLSLAEDVSLITAREALIRAERAAGNLPQPDEAVRKFISRLDVAISSGRPANVRGLLEQQNLKSFTVGIAFVKSWKTDIVRAHRLDRHRVVLDVRTMASTSERQRSAKALYVLHQQGSTWKVLDIPAFLEK